MPTETINRCAPTRATTIILRAKTHSDRLIATARTTIEDYLQRNSLSTTDMGFLVVGSVGRREALEASDFDFIPIATDQARLANYRPHDAVLRSAIAEALGAKVSQGQDLTAADCLPTLIDAESIGGTADKSGALTKRILILTESRHITGELDIDTMRSILDAYARENRTSGRHVLSLCNDIARYYKTLCIEYKAKIDDEDKDWCSRNMKLRHSRKFWYFSAIIAFATLAERHPLGSDAYVDALLEMFSLPPCERLARALGESQPLELGRLIESYAMFLDFMSSQTNRSALARVEHDERYRMNLGNPFPAMKFNSDVLHQCMMSILDAMTPAMRNRVISWFLL